MASRRRKVIGKRVFTLTGDRKRAKQVAGVGIGKGTKARAHAYRKAHHGGKTIKQRYGKGWWKVTE